MLVPENIKSYHVGKCDGFILDSSSVLAVAKLWLGQNPRLSENAVSSKSGELDDIFCDSFSDIAVARNILVRIPEYYLMKNTSKGKVKYNK